jgi:hypothetical protein
VQLEVRPYRVFGTNKARSWDAHQPRLHSYDSYQIERMAAARRRRPVQVTLEFLVRPAVDDDDPCSRRRSLSWCLSYSVRFSAHGRLQSHETSGQSTTLMQLEC